jgi:peptide/nickel transport system substrate-binding protein
MGRHGISIGVAAPPPRRPSRDVTRTAIALTALTSLLLACTPSAQPAASSAPANPVAPSAAAGATPVTAPVAAKAAGAAQGQIVIVNEAEPETLVPKDGSKLSYVLLDNVYDHLTGREFSSGVGKIVPQLADSWTRSDPTTWRFKLHQGVQFTNGEPFTADAVVTAVADMVDPQKPGRALNEYGTLQSATKVDEFTVDITTKDPDPILPDRLVRLAIPAPNWLKTANLDAASSQAVGSGPYMLTDYQRGQYLLFKANPNYWGPNKPKIAEIKLIGRSEQSVRAAMLQAGEADLAYSISLEDAKQAPRTIIQQTQESPMFRINSEHPVLRDVRVRQALVEAIDTQGMITSLYPGGIAVPLQGQLVRQGSVGWNPNLKPYPYNPDEAKRLLQEAGAVGTPVTYFDKPGYFPRADEVGELIINELNAVGFKATIRHLEAKAALDAMKAVKPDQQRTDLQMTSAGSPVLDSSRIFDLYYVCSGLNRIGCDPEFDRRYIEARGLTGEARDQAFQSIWAYAYDKYWYMPLFGLNWAHGASARLQWTPRIDGMVLFTEMSLTP